MKLLTLMAATAAAAAVAAALSLPAGADQNHATGPPAPAELVSCLRARGLNPPADLFRLKPWIARQAGTAAGKAALSACGMDFSAPRRDDTGKELAACLRSHGADVPPGAQGLALKTWIGDHSGDSNVMSALKLCGDGPAKSGDCGGQPASPRSASAAGTKRSGASGKLRVMRTVSRSS